MKDIPSLPNMKVCPRCEGCGFEEYYNASYDTMDVKDYTLCSGTGKLIKK